MRYTKNQIITAVEYGVMRTYSVTRDDLRRARNPYAEDARHIMFYLLHDEYGFKFREIAEMFGRNTSTISHGIRKIRCGIENKQNVALMVGVVMNTVKAKLMMLTNEVKSVIDAEQVNNKMEA